MVHDAEQPPRLLLPTLFPLRKVRLVTPDPLQERVARVLRMVVPGPFDPDAAAAAVLADLREAGELRTLEQVGYCVAVDVALLSDDDLFIEPDEIVECDALYRIVREDNGE